MRKIDLAGFRMTHRLRHCLVRVTEWNAFPDQIVGEVGRGRVSRARGRTHACRIDLDPSRDQIGDYDERGQQRVDDVEHRLLVFLVVLVVRQRLTFHDRQQRDQIPENASAFSPYELRHVGILFLRHDRAAGAEPVGQADKAEARAGPENQFFREARQVHHRQRRRRGEFDGEVAIGNGVERVFAQAVEAQLARNAVALDRKARSRQRRTAQRQAIDACAAISESLGVAREHRIVCHEMVAECDRLRDLKVRESRHDGGSVRFGQIEQRASQCGDARRQVVDRGAYVEPHVGRDLIVAGTAGVQSLAGVADQRDQPLFDIEVYVLEVA